MARADGQSGGAVRGRRPKGQGRDLRQVILDAAEHLFSGHGFHGVTVRQVATEAGVDTALIHYYFGSKRELFDHVFARRANDLNQDRMAAMQAYVEEAQGPLDVERIIAAFIDPLIERSLNGGDGWKNYFRLVALVNNTPAWGGETMNKFFDPVVRELVHTLGLARTDANERDLYWCYQFLTGAMMLTLSETGRIDTLSGGQCHASDLEAARRRLYVWCAGGITAVVERMR